MSRAPVAVWWFLLLVVTGVVIVPLGSVEHRSEQAGLELEVARGWEGTTQLVEGRFVRMSRVQEVLPRSYSARSTYLVDAFGTAAVEVDVPARSAGGPPQESEQPERLDLRVARDRDRVEAVQWGESLATLDVEIAQRADAADAARDRATLVRWVVALVLGVLLVGCVLLTVAASRGPGGLARRFAGTRASADADADADRLDRAARSPELPVGMLVLTLFALVVPLGWPDRGTAVLSGFVALAAVSLLLREREAVDRAAAAGAAGAAAATGRRRVALVWRGSAVVGVLLGLLLLFLGWFALGVAPDADEGGEMLRRGLGVLVLSGATVAAAAAHRARGAQPE